MGGLWSSRLHQLFNNYFLKGMDESFTLRKYLFLYIVIMQFWKFATLQKIRNVRPPYEDFCWLSSTSNYLLFFRRILSGLRSAWITFSLCRKPRTVNSLNATFLMLDINCKIYTILTILEINIQYRYILPGNYQIYLNVL